MKYTMLVLIAMSVAGNKSSVDIGGRSNAEQGVADALRAGANDIQIHGKHSVSLHADRATVATFTPDATTVLTDLRVAGPIALMADGTPAWRWHIEDSGAIVMQRWIGETASWAAVARFQ